MQRVGTLFIFQLLDVDQDGSSTHVHEYIDPKTFMFHLKREKGNPIFVSGNTFLEMENRIFGNGHPFPNSLYEFWKSSSKCQYLEF